MVTTANIVSNDVINQPALATPSEIDNLKSNEAYTMVIGHVLPTLATLL